MTFGDDILDFEDIFFDDLVNELRSLEYPASMEASQMQGWKLAKDACIRSLYAFFGRSLPKGENIIRSDILDVIAEELYQARVMVPTSDDHYVWNSAIRVCLTRLANRLGAKAVWLDNVLQSFAESPMRFSRDDAVDHPGYYKQGSLEVIDAIEGLCLPFHLGNALKYIARAGKKDPDKLYL